MKKTLLNIVKFSKLKKQKEADLVTRMKYLWDYILSQHPLTRSIFIKDRVFDIQHSSTYKKLIDNLDTIDLSSTNYDVLGNAYEAVIKDIMTGKVLGQFFTQPEVKDIMVNLIKPKVFKNGTIETFGDPTMGTGGFLITYLKYVLDKAEKKGIAVDWNFIVKEGLYGKEIEPDTYQLAVSNMLISSGHMFEKLERGDSIRQPIDKKFDNVLANPPYGIKGLNYDDIKSSIRDEYVPIKSINAVSLFIQAIIYMLKINGKGAVVLPDGQDLFSKSNKTLVAVREYLFKTCDLKQVIYLPSGIFTNTSIKTCIFYFIKKAEGSDIITIKEKNRTYKFTEEHKTKKVKFYQYKQEDKTKELLAKVDIKDIEENSYSLNYAEYVEEEKASFSKDVKIVKLGELCVPNQGTSLTRNKINSGIFEVIGGGKVIGKHNKKNRDGDELIITRVGDINIKYMCDPYYLTENGFSLKSSNEDILTKYIYYYFSNNKDYLTSLYNGVAQKVISKTALKSFEITIPSLEVQNDIVKYLDFIEDTNQTNRKKIDELKKLNVYFLKNQTKYGKNEVKKLAEVCNINIGGTPSRNNDDYYQNGKNLWVSVRELKGGYIYDTREKITDLGAKKSSVKLFDKGTVLFSFKLSIGKTAIVGKPLYTNEAIAGLYSRSKDVLNNKYLYYYISMTDFTKFASGVIGGGSLNKASLATLIIHIPSLEQQQEIVEYCERNDKKIEELEEEIERNKDLAKSFLDRILTPE